MTDTPKPRRTFSYKPATGLIPIARRRHSRVLLAEAEEAHYWNTHSLELIWDQLEDVTDSPPWGLNPLRCTPNVRKRPPATP